ncbi:claudin-9-like [Esox lucius]|uniref:Claudin n=1 Tax=Esox lucius TaxID=8010 RepID=A0AAY5L7X4_ESOLU|nr:claudin-9-like [Esox lucius]
MASTGLQLLGLLLAVMGWVGGALVCAAPLWRVSAFVGGEIVIAQVMWEGLWMTCLSQSTGEIQCKTYDSTLALPTSAQASRGLCVISLLLCLFALLLGVVGVKCTTCLGEGAYSSKARLARVAGAMFVGAGLLYLAPICWTAYAVVRDFYDPNIAAPLKRELGPALYLGWGSGILLLVGGALLNAGSAPPAVRPTPTYGGGGRSNPLPVVMEEKEYV